MKDVFLVYDTSCFYEIVILNYFMSVTGCDVVICSLDGRSIRSMEGYSVNVDCALAEVDFTEARSFVVPGGDVRHVMSDEVKGLLCRLKETDTVLAAICAGVDLLDEAGILTGIESTHSTDENVVCCGNVITARANGYVDFAIEVAKKLDLFEDEADLQETIDFWKYFKSI